MRVIGAGFGRTGTSSLKSALEQLDFDPCYHMWEFFEHPEHAPAWLAAAAGEAVDWDQVFAGFQACVDWPAAAYWEQLMAVYPEAKVLLSVRDPERWYESVLATINNSEVEPGSDPEREADPTSRVINSTIWQGTFGGRFCDKAHALSIFEQHNRDVQERVPPDRLLVYDVREGWEPLCRFLGVDVPAGPFPKVNTRQEWEERRERGELRSSSTEAADV